jgi:hypothetical protein
LRWREVLRGIAESGMRDWRNGVVVMLSWLVERQLVSGKGIMNVLSSRAIGPIRRAAVAAAGAALAVTGVLAPATTAHAVAPAAECAVASDAVALVGPSRPFDARTNYAASTGTIDWTSNWFHVHGSLVDTKKHSSTSYTYVHYETKYTGGGCSVWVKHEPLVATAKNGKKVRINFDYGPAADRIIRNVWVETCTSRNGWTCSGWK